MKPACPLSLLVIALFCGSCFDDGFGLDPIPDIFPIDDIPYEVLTYEASGEVNAGVIDTAEFDEATATDGFGFKLRAYVRNTAGEPIEIDVWTTADPSPGQVAIWPGPEEDGVTGISRVTIVNDESSRSQIAEIVVVAFGETGDVGVLMMTIDAGFEEDQALSIRSRVRRAR